MGDSKPQKRLEEHQERPLEACLEFQTLLWVSIQNNISSHLAVGEWQAGELVRCGYEKEHTCVIAIIRPKGSTMAGLYGTLQSTVEEESPRKLFTPQAAHPVMLVEQLPSTRAAKIENTRTWGILHTYTHEYIYPC